MNRLNRCKETKPENAPILYENGAFGKRLKPTDSVDELFKIVGQRFHFYIGLYSWRSLYGSDWNTIKKHTILLCRLLSTYMIIV